MVQAQLHKPAIKAIENLIGIARYLALQERDHKLLADFLDGVSFLPQLLLDSNEKTSDFIECLKELEKRVPETQLVIHEFENSMTM